MLAAAVQTVSPGRSICTWPVLEPALFWRSLDYPLGQLQGSDAVVLVQDPHALEDLTGLTELHNAAAALMMDASEEEEDENDSLLKGNDQTSAAAGDDWTEL